MSQAAGRTRVLVTGVRGKTGDPLARLLASRPEVEVLGGSSDPSAVRIDGVRPIAFSWDDPEGWAAAVEETDAVYVVRPDRPEAPELIHDLLALTPATSRVVLLSEQDADSVGPEGWAPRAEHAVRESGHDWTILRPSWFMQVFTDPRFFRDQIVRGEDLAFAAGGGRIAWIDARDIAAVAEQALLGGGHGGRTYELTGPRALSLTETADLLSRVAGRPVEIREVSVEDAVAGTEGFERDLNVVTFERVAAGSFATVTDTVEQVTGTSARSLETFLLDSRSTLSGTTG